MLTERQKAILKAVIENYIKSAKPVSSWDLTEKRDLRVSSATIRNEFAALEETGHLFQPHTSAGRLPTEKAYRFYVEECLKERELARSEREKVAQELFSESEKRDAILKNSWTRSRNRRPKFTSVARILWGWRSLVLSAGTTGLPIATVFWL